MRKVLPRKFYSRNTLKVARDLLGCFLIRECRGKIWRAMITETEAYRGEDIWPATLRAEKLPERK